VQAAGGAMPRIEAFYRALRFIDARNVVGNMNVLPWNKESSHVF
jgi:hypothetical protein